MKNIVVTVDKNGVRVGGIEQKPDGYADKLVERYVPTEGITELPELPDKPDYYEDTLAVWVPALRLWVCCNHMRWQESSSGSNPYEEEISQPFQVGAARLWQPDMEETKTLEKIGVFFKQVDLYPANQVCPNCGKQAICYSEDVGGGNTFWDLYCLHCPACGHAEFYDQYAGEKDCPSEEATVCKYCGRNCFAHEELPAELTKRYQEQKAVENLKQQLQEKYPLLAEPSSIRRIEQPCPKCGQQTVYCIYKDVGNDIGVVGCCDNYCHFCANLACDYAETTSSFDSSLGQEDAPPEPCPLCKRDSPGEPPGESPAAEQPVPTESAKTPLDAVIENLQPVLAEIVRKRVNERIPLDLHTKTVVCELLGKPCPVCSKGTLISYRSDSDSFLIHICLNPLCDYLKHLCPKCGANIKRNCIGEGGGADYSWTWVHICTRSPDCDFRSHYSSFECNQGQLVVSGIEPSSGSCPGCGGNAGR